MATILSMEAEMKALRAELADAEARIRGDAVFAEVEADNARLRADLAAARDALGDKATEIAGSQAFVDAHRQARADLAAAQAEVAKLTAERDDLKTQVAAAVGRNIRLHEQKTREAEDARVQRVPVADFALRVIEVLRAKDVADDVVDAVNDIDGWTGDEGGFSPGLETTLFVPRSRLDAAREAVKIVDANLLEQRARAEKAEATLDASRRQVAVLREALKAVVPLAESRAADLGEAAASIEALSHPAAQASVVARDLAGSSVDAARAVLADTEAAARGYVRVEDLRDPVLVERLAAVEHDRWSKWEQWRTRESVTPDDEARWKRQRVTPYTLLSEKEKESDRKEARATLVEIGLFLGVSLVDEKGGG